MTDQDESSVLFNLKELMGLEEDRLKSEAEAKRKREEDELLAKQEAERRRIEEEQARVRAIEDARRQEEQRKIEFEQKLTR